MRVEENNQNLNEIIKSSSKKPNGKVIGMIIAIVAVLGIGIGIFAFSGQNKAAFKKLSGTPEEVVAAALSNTNRKLLLEEEAIQKQLGGDHINSIRNKEANELSFDIVLKSMDGIEDQDIVNAYIKDLGLSGTLQSVKDGSKGNGKLSVTQSGIELLGASLYKVDNEIGVSIPKILDTPYAVKLDSLIEDYENSALYQLMGGESIDEEALAEVQEMIDAFSEYMTGAMTLSTNEEFMTQSEAVQAELIKEANLAVKGRTTLILSNGKEKECSVYAGTLTNSQVAQFMKDEMNILMNLEFVKNYINVVGEQAGYTVEDMLEEMNNLEVTSDNGTLEIEILVDGTYFVGANLKFMDGDTNQEVGTLTFNYAGEKHLTDSIFFDFNIAASDDVAESMNIKFNFNQNFGDKADVLTQDLVCSLSADAIDLGNFTYSYAYDTKAKEDNLNVSFGMDIENELAMDYTATGTKTITSEEVSTNLTSALVSIQEGTENFTLNFGLNYGIKAIKANDIAMDQTGAQYILEMTQDELINLVQTIQSNIQVLAFSLM